MVEPDRHCHTFGLANTLIMSHHTSSRLARHSPHASLCHCLRVSLCVWFIVSLSRVRSLQDPQLPGIFYPFGTDVGDAVAPTDDDGATDRLNINVSFVFFNNNYTGVYINANGAVSFKKKVVVSEPVSFPVEPSLTMIAPYWSDVDMSVNNGRLYYRNTTTDTGVLNRATGDVRQAFGNTGFSNFQAKWVLVATWHNVTHYGGTMTSPVPTNSFQVVLITDGRFSFVEFNYGMLSWPAQNSVIMAQAGYSAGDEISPMFKSVPGSRKWTIVNVASTSNVNVTGRWMYRADNKTPLPACTPDDNVVDCTLCTGSLCLGDATCQNTATSQYMCPTCPLWQLFDGKHSSGGIPTPRSSVAGCKQACLDRTDCVALDFDVTSSTPCWLLVTPDFMDSRADSPGIKEFVLKQRCASATTVSIVTACTPVWQTVNGVHSNGANWINIAPRVVDVCKQTCLSNTACVAVEFAMDRDPNECWMHTEIINLQNTIKDRPNITQYRLTRC